jgi:hypothetical protein
LALRGDLLVTLPRRLRAPQEHGAILAEPPLAVVEELVRQNRQRLAGSDFHLLGRSWAELRHQAHQTAVAVAKDYLQQAGEPVPDYCDTSLFLAGHQPELFHPGVWVKNFALNGLARNLGATPINLIVDQDTAKATVLRLPALPEAWSVERGAWSAERQAFDAPRSTLGALRSTLHASAAGIVSLPFDQWAGEVPYEERTVRDEELFATLLERAAVYLKDWPFVPLLPAYWTEALRQAKRTPLLGERLVAARRVFERRWACSNLELPVSRLCGTEPFAWFACHLLAELRRFHAIYNNSVHAYRRQYGIRSRNHPVPDLAQEGGWLETPFWGWRAGRNERGRLLARCTDEGLILRVGTESWPELPGGANRDPAALIRAWQELKQRGYKIRSRALTNTLFARLFLADLFIHGIGGGKYDELTDEIARRFYGFELPRYLVLSATLLLPLPTFPARPAERQRLARQLRDLYYNPQRHLGNGAVAPPSAYYLAAEKQAWIAQQPTTAPARQERFHVLRTLTEKLRAHVDDRISVLEQKIMLCDQELRANAILQRRDYPFCLYPEGMLRDSLQGIIKQTMTRI